MQENELNKFRTLVFEVSSFVSNPVSRVGNVLIFEKNDRFVKKTSRKIGKQNDRFLKKFVF